jgi:hypothetical protein
MSSSTEMKVHWFRECSALWRNLTSEERALAAHIATVAWNNQIEAIDVTLVEDRDTLQLLVDKGVLCSDANYVRFVVSGMLPYVVAWSVVQEKGWTRKPDDVVFQEMLEIEGEEADFHRARNLCDFSIAILVNELDRRSLLWSIAEQREGEDKRRFWLLYDSICNCIPVLALTTAEFANLFEAFLETVQNDLGGGRISGSAFYLGQLRPKSGLDVIQEILGSDRQFAYSVLASLLKGLGYSDEVHFATARSLCADWLINNNAQVRRAGVYCLSEFGLDQMIHVEQTLGELERLIDDDDEGVACALAESISALALRFESTRSRCLKLLRALASGPHRWGVLHGIAARIAYARGDEALDVKLAFLPQFADVPPEHKGTVREINTLLYSLARSNPEEVWHFLKSWVLKHELGEPVSDHKMFLRTLQGLYQWHRDLFMDVVTTWLAADDVRLIEESKEIIVEFQVHQLSPRTLQNMAEEDIVYLTEKILSGRIVSPLLPHLVFSVVIGTEMASTLKDYFLWVINYLAWNYPGYMREKLERVCATENGTAKEIAAVALEVLDKYEQKREGLDFPELFPSLARVRRYQEFEEKRRREIQEIVADSDRFPLQKFFPKVAVGRGNRTFCMFIGEGRRFSEPGSFGLIQQVVELPRGEFLDPEGEAWRRRQRALTRRDKGLESD